MGKANELSMIVSELRKCGETLVGISEELTAVFSGTDEEKAPVTKAEVKKKPVDEPKMLTLEDVRAVCADKSRNGFTAEIKAILIKHGAEKLSEVDPTEYKSLLAEVTRVGLTEVLGNAK